MCQKDEQGNRTDVEQRLFSHALPSQDEIYAHRGAVSFLSTALPDGFEAGVTLVPGLVAGPDGTLVPGPVPVRGYGDRGWTGFEQCIGAIIKKSRAPSM